jgi:hypothetical protein
MKFKELREKYRSKFPSSLVAAAVKIAIDMGGNMTGAHKKIEAMKKGLANDPMVKDALRQANESVNEETVKLVDMDDDSHKTAVKLAQKAGVKVVSKKTKTGTELSVSGPNKNIGKFMMSLPESVQKVKEGTWDIPDTKTKLQKLMDLVSKPYFATTEKEVDKYLKLMPFGDDELYDDLGVLYFIPGSTKSKKFPKTDLNKVAMDSLNGRWLTAKKKGQGYDITHINFDVDMDEAIKRKSGNIRPGRRMKVDLSAGSKY